MVQVSFDTNNDTLEELKEALNLLQQSIERRGGKPPVHERVPKAAKLDIAHPEEPSDDETSIDTPFFKITVKNEEVEPEPQQEAPTLNQLLDEASLTDDEFSKLFHEQVKREHPEHKKHKEEESKEDAYIEIVEYEKQ